jgi:heme exporter protein D
MTHLPYIAAAYGLTVLITGGFSVAAWLRMRSATARLAAIDPRARR